MSRDFSRKFYSSAKWIKTQRLYMQSQGYICERCGNLARVVHHKTFLTPENINKPEVSLDWDNLEALCMNCHAKAHGKTDICNHDLMFDFEGNLIKKQKEQ